MLLKRHTMKHTTKQAKGIPSSVKKRMIGLRLDEAEMQLIEKIATAEQRSLAQTARVLLRRGMESSKSAV